MCDCTVLTVSHLVVGWGVGPSRPQCALARIGSRGPCCSKRGPGNDVDNKKARVLVVVRAGTHGEHAGGVYGKVTMFANSGRQQGRQQGAKEKNGTDALNAEGEVGRADPKARQHSSSSSSSSSAGAGGLLRQ